MLDLYYRLYGHEIIQGKEINFGWTWAKALPKKSPVELSDWTVKPDGSKFSLGANFVSR